MIWGGLVFSIVMAMTGGNPQAPTGPWLAQLVGFFVMTIPFTLYFTFSEASKHRATVGKRTLGISVSTVGGSRMTRGKALIRNGIKFLPWEIGHLVAQQSVYSEALEMPTWLWGAVALAFGVPLWWLVSLFVKGKTPYDRWTRTVVSISD